MISDFRGLRFALPLGRGLMLLFVVCFCIQLTAENYYNARPGVASGGSYCPTPPGGDWTTGAALDSADSYSDLAEQELRRAFPVLYPPNDQTILVLELCEQALDGGAQNIEAKVWPALGTYNKEYEGLASFGCEDPINNLFANIGQIFLCWIVVPGFEPFVEARFFNLLVASDIKQQLCLHLVIISSFTFALLHRRTGR